MDSSLSLFYRNTGPNCFIISKQLRRFFGDKFDDKFDDYDEEDFKIFLQYVKTSLSKGREIDFSLREYYNAILPDFLAQLKRHEDLIKAYKMPSDWERLFPTLTYQTHILDVQAVKIKYPGHKIYYSVCYDNEESWSEEVSNDQMAGITGNFKSIKIWLGEASTKEFDILYRVHKFDGEWTDWAKNGKSIYLQGVKLNALQIKLEPKRM